VTNLPAGRPGFASRQGQGFCLLANASRPALESTQPPIEWLTWVFSGIKAAGAWSWPLTSSSEVKIVRSYISTPPIRLHGMVLKYRDNFTFYLTGGGSGSHCACWFSTSGPWERVNLLHSLNHQNMNTGKHTNIHAHSVIRTTPSQLSKFRNVAFQQLKSWVALEIYKSEKSFAFVLKDLL
jgi:hypothetical protein